MSKAVRWQVPFVSLQGIHYRVDIYDEGYTGTPVQLYAGPTPFVTDEESSEDYFAAVRAQTGTLQVCTRKPDGGTITLADLMPETSVARPVRLINVDNSDAIEWRGFLSCEDYNQDYTAIPDNVSIPVKGVISAMSDIELGATTSLGLLTVRKIISKCLQRLNSESGIGNFTYVYVSTSSINFLTTYMDASILFEMKEVVDESKVYEEMTSSTCLEVLERICTFMGWVCREEDGSIFFQRLGEPYAMTRYPYVEFTEELQPVTPGDVIVPLTSGDMAALTWMGDGHQVSRSSGAKSVEVVAKMTDYKLQLQIPECPTGDYTAYILNRTMNAGAKYLTAFLYGATNRQTLELGFYILTTNWSDYVFSVISDVSPTTAQSVADDTIAIKGSQSLASQFSYGTAGFYSFVAGAFQSRLSVEDQAVTLPELGDGLYCALLPYQEYGNPQFDFTPYPIATFRTIIKRFLPSGYFRISADYLMIASSLYIRENQSDMRNYTARFQFILQFGSLYWNGTAWQSTKCAFNINSKADDAFEFEDTWTASMDISQVDGYVLQLPSGNSNRYGEVKLSLLIPAHDGPTNNCFEVFFKSLELEYIPSRSIFQNERTENCYYKMLGTNFRDDTSVSVDIATDANNNPSPTLLRDSNKNTIKSIVYANSASENVRMRPETDLRDRLAVYYGAARQRLELEVAHPTAAPLPLLRLNGINEGKVYLPLSESRDWQTDECKLTCFETPT